MIELKSHRSIILWFPSKSQFIVNSLSMLFYKVSLKISID